MGGESSAVDGAEAALSEAVVGGEGGGGVAEDGVGEAVWGLRVGRDGSFADDFAEANSEKDEEGEGGGDTAGKWGEEAVAVVRRRRR